MNYNNSSHSRNNNGHVQSQNNISSSRQQSTSLLSGLLSKADRSKQQADRYRLQEARPFEDTSQIGQAAVRANNITYSRQLSQESKTARGDDSSHGRVDSSKGSKNDHDNQSSSNNEVIPRKSSDKSSSSTGTNISSRKVTFGPASVVDSIPAVANVENTTRPVPRRKRSRWDVKPPTEEVEQQQSKQPKPRSSRWDVKPTETTVQFSSASHSSINNNAQMPMQDNEPFDKNTVGEAVPPPPPSIPRWSPPRRGVDPFSSVNPSFHAEGVNNNAHIPITMQRQQQQRQDNESHDKNAAGSPSSRLLSPPRKKADNAHKQQTNTTIISANDNSYENITSNMGEKRPIMTGGNLLSGENLHSSHSNLMRQGDDIPSQQTMCKTSAVADAASTTQSAKANEETNTRQSKNEDVEIRQQKMHTKQQENPIPEQSMRDDKIHTSPRIERSKNKMPSSEEELVSGKKKMSIMQSPKSAIPKKKKKRKMEESNTFSQSSTVSKPSPTSEITRRDDKISSEGAIPKKKKKGKAKEESKNNNAKSTISKPQATSASSSTPFVTFTAPPPKKKRKKEFSPFRVKLGCVVAVRFRKLDMEGNSDIISVIKDADNTFRAVEPTSQGTNGTSSNQRERKDSDATDTSTTTKKHNTKLNLHEVWSVPIPGKDDGLSLLGSWIRCRFTKSFVSKWQKNNNVNGTNTEKLGHILEGNVISILGNDGNDTSTKRRKGTTVHLLVDRSALKSLPYVEIVSDESGDATLSSTEQKRRQHEIDIRGENNVVVRITLSSIFDQRNGSKLGSGMASWAVRKRVSAKPSGKKPTKKERKRSKQHADSLFVGDGNDTQSQQEQNWRWIVSHTSCQQIGVGSDNDLYMGHNVRDHAPQLVGEVVGITRSAPDESSTSLATVTFKLLLTPEQMKDGRQSHHGPLELFDTSTDNSNDELYFQAPIEDLIVIGKRINRLVDDWKQPNAADSPVVENDGGWIFTVTHSFLSRDKTCMPLTEDSTTTKESLKPCHYCQRFHHNSQLQMCQHEHDGSVKALWCASCLQLSEGLSAIRSFNNNIKSNVDDGELRIGPAFSDLVEPLQSTAPIPFALPVDTANLFLRPSFVPNSGNMKSKSYTNDIKKVEVTEKKSEKKQGKQKKKKNASDVKARPKKKVKAKKSDKSNEEEEQAIKYECHREVSFDRLNKKDWGSSKIKLASSPDKQPFFREKARPRAIKIGKSEEKTTLSGRAARASQRRMFKSLAALGDSKVDRLAGSDRAQHLRFDKSKIHGWGVFAEEPINAGDMIIEYRGELIGNAVADKREREYKDMKMDDYMFRIDAFTVCDATMLGNVARYINASCSPNCYTQIITAGENRRIVIYAKRDIHRGEELCYDYKFSLEYDPTERIPCHCRAPECRGFMNWDKKYE